MTTALRKMARPRMLTKHRARPAACGPAACVIAAVCAVLVIGGCASTAAGTGSKESILPQNLKSMDEIYREHTQRAKSRDSHAPLAAPIPKDTTPQSDVPERGDPARPANLRHASWDTYTRSAATEIENLFPTLPNPSLVMHVFAHLSGTENTPVPGYATAFPMYERVEYALPGEMEYRHPEVARPAPEKALPEPARPAAVVTYSPSMNVPAVHAPAAIPSLRIDSAMEAVTRADPFADPFEFLNR